MLARIWGFGMWPSSCRRSSDHQSAPCCSHCSSVIATAARPRRFPRVGPGTLLKFGNRLEVFHGPAIAGDPFRPGRPISGFRTGPARYGTRRAQRQRRRTAAILLPRLAEPIGPAISTAASEQALKFALDSPLEQAGFEPSVPQMGRFRIDHVGSRAIALISVGSHVADTSARRSRPHGGATRCGFLEPGPAGLPARLVEGNLISDAVYCRP